MSDSPVKLSVIVPVHNLQDYLEECMQSILNQTLRDIEVICIDDHSSDDSLDILQNFARKDSRVKVECLAQIGPGAARNYGISKASGDFLGFVDGDDWIEPDMFEKLYSRAIHAGSPIAICNAQAFESTSGKSVDFPYFQDQKRALNKVCGELLRPDEFLPLLPRLLAMPWNKIYNRQFLERCKAQFAALTPHEDLPFFFKALLPAPLLAVVREPLYHYRAFRPGSSMSSLALQADNPVVEILSATEGELAEELRDPLKKSAFNTFKTRQLLHSLQGVYHNRSLPAKHRKAFYGQVQKAVKSLPLTQDISWQERILLTLLRHDYYSLFQAKLNLDRIQLRRKLPSIY